MLSPETEAHGKAPPSGPSTFIWIALFAVLGLALIAAAWFLDGCSDHVLAFDGETATYCGPAFEDAGAAMVSLENSSDVPVLMGFIEVLDEDVSLAEIADADVSAEPEWLGTWTILREVPAGESLEYETILPAGIYTFWVLDETTGDISLSGRVDTR
jgi:hypothetical protein